MRITLITAGLVILSLTACVSKKKYLEATNQLKIELERSNARLETCQNKNDLTEAQLRNAREELDYWKRHSTNLLDRLSELSILSQAEAANLKKSLEKIDEQDVYIRKLTAASAKKDSMNIVLVTNLKKSLGAVDDKDVQITIKKGVVYVSISDQMLFKTGSSTVSPEAKRVLGKVADVIKSQPGLDIMVEGHTDNVPISTECVSDNWDLSVKRATSIVRLLQVEHGVPPERLIAAGRGEYLPKTDNDDAEGRRINRRTEIIIVPKLDEFFKLVEPSGGDQSGE